MIWSNWDSFLSQKQKWFNNNFKEIDAEALVKQVGKYGKENIDMKMKMAKDERDEVLEELTRDVKEVEAMRNLILALGSRAMLHRHWIKIYALLETPAPNLDVGITLQSLVEDLSAMDKLDDIEDISGGAQGEMQIENTMKLV